MVGLKIIVRGTHNLMGIIIVIGCKRGTAMVIMNKLLFADRLKETETSLIIVRLKDTKIIMIMDRL